MPKKKGPKPPIVTSRERTRRELERAVLHAAPPEGNTPASVIKDVVSYETKGEEKMTQGVEVRVFFYTEEQLSEKLLKVEGEASNLPENVRNLYEQTRDGQPTSELEKNGLIDNPKITGDDIYKAISLGIESWATNFLKER